jgi:haloalkane dehalogenase
VAGSPPKTVDGISYREALPAGAGPSAPVALFLHGYPTSSYLWRKVLPEASAAGYRAIAPDLPGFGDSPPDLPGTWEHQVEHVEHFRQALGLGQVVLAVHDWGGLIGLRWACDHPDAIRALAITDTGFFPDGRWHGFAKVLQTPGEGETMLANMNREAFAATLAHISPGIAGETVDEFFKAFADEDRHRNQLDLYRSGDFSKLEAYDGKLSALGVPALIVWGGKDEFAPVGGAHRFHKQLPGSRLVVLDDAGHFLMEDDPDRVSAEIRGFLQSL